MLSAEYDRISTKSLAFNVMCSHGGLIKRWKMTAQHQFDVGVGWTDIARQDFFFFASSFVEPNLTSAPPSNSPASLHSDFHFERRCSLPGQVRSR